ncbi:Heat shock protein-like protein pss1 [Diplonema papillatum]|nr:Heat shock protein-like protein pss1 [Diplonema papillatum]
MDCEGVCRAVFFYPEQLDAPFTYDMLRIGVALEIRSPRLHRFLDGQDGIRQEQAEAVRVEGKEELTPAVLASYATSLKGLGNAHFQSGRYEAATSAYQLSIEVMTSGSTAAACCLNLAACAQKLGKHEQAVAECRKAVRLGADEAKTGYRMGVSYRALGDYANAEEVLQRASKLSRGDACVEKALAAVRRDAAGKRAREAQMWRGMLAP